MADPAHEAADRAVEAFKAEVREVYLQAETDAQEVFSAFLARFEEKDAAMRAKVEAGELSRDDWLRWRKSAMLVGKRHASVLEQAARACSHANEAAMAALSGRLPEVYAENANFAAFEVCRESGLDLSFDLVDADTVRHMLTAGEALIALPALNVAKDLAWNRKLVASQLTQGVLLGESIPKLAKRVQRVAGSNYATAVRTARTAVTGAENAGRVSSYRRAQAMGIDVEQEWLATLDGRTRHSHRRLDGERIPVGGKFSNGCRYPGDPEAAYAETMNCRCTLVPAVAGIDQSDAYRWSRLPAGMTYEQWKAGKAAEKSASAVQAVVSGGQKASAGAVRAVLSRSVTLGPVEGKGAADYIDLGGMGKNASKLFDRAARYVPTSMLDTLRRGKVKAVRDLSLGRSLFDPVANELRIGKGADELTVVHEIMHAVEEHDPDFLEAERVYFDRRTAGKRRVPVRRFTGNSGYDPSEMAFDVGSACISPYAFKDYGGNGYELMSMGVETLYRDPAAYVRDPDMLRWVLQMLGRFGK